MGREGKGRPGKARQGPVVITQSFKMTSLLYHDSLLSLDVVSTSFCDKVHYDLVVHCST